MLDSIYIGMTGLISFSKGLSGIGNDVANLNTTGYKGSQLEFTDLYYRYQYSGNAGQDGGSSMQGSGVRTGVSTLRFAQGEFKQTGNDLDAAINGSGFFVLQEDGKTFYTRAGQFKIDDAGYLVTTDGSARVAGLTNGNTLTDISISGKRSSPAKATQTASFANTLAASATTANVQNIAVYDSLGVKHLLTLNLTKDSTVTTEARWTFTLLENSTTLTTGEVRYANSGLPQPGFDSQTFTYTPGNGGSAQSIKLDFANTNYLSSASSSISVGSADGYAAGFLTKTAFDTNGYLVLTYSNGQTAKGDRLALAWFDNLSALQAEGSNRFSVFGDTTRHLSGAGDSGFGPLKTSGVELSNVDLASEFSELIIVQRGYQASSQVITAANEMIQQLGEIRGRR